MLLADAQRRKHVAVDETDETPASEGLVRLRARLGAIRAVRLYRTSSPVSLRDLALPGRQHSAQRTSVCRTDARKTVVYDASANVRRQHGHSPSNPLTSARNADGCGSVVIALNASGARCA